MRTLDALWPLIGVGTLVFAAVVLMSVIGFIDSRWRRMMARTPATPIAATRPGQLAKVCGLARRLDSVLTAPITGRPCLAYVVSIERHERHGKQGYVWQHWTGERREVGLLLEDRTGRIRLELDRSVELDLDYDREIESGSFETLDERVARFLRERQQEPPTGILLRRPLRCREHVLREGQAVAALGRVDVASASPAPTEPVPAEPVQRGPSVSHVLRRPSPKQPLLLSNRAARIEQKLLPEPAEIELSIDIDLS